MNLVKDLDLETLEQEGMSEWLEHKQLMINALEVYYKEGPTDNYTSLYGLLDLVKNNFKNYSIPNLQEILCWLDVVRSTVIMVGNASENLEGCLKLVDELRQKIIPMIILSYNIQSDMTDEYNSHLYFPINTFTTDLVDGGVLVINTDKYGKIKISGGLPHDSEAEHKLLNLRTIIPQDTWDKVRNNNYAQSELEGTTDTK